MMCIVLGCQVSAAPTRVTLDPVSAQRKRRYQCQCRRCVERLKNWRMSEKRAGRRPLMRLWIEYLLWYKPAAAIYAREDLHSGGPSGGSVRMTVLPEKCWDRERFVLPLHIRTHSTYNIELIFFNIWRFYSLHACLYL